MNYRAYRYSFYREKYGTFHDNYKQKILFNSKSCYMLFHPNKQVLNRASSKESKSISQALKPEIKLYIGQNKIKEVTDTRFLGVQFDPLLNWSTHIQTLRKKLISCFAVIKRISTFIPRKNYKNIYHTLFESHLSYCISVWGGAN